MDKDFIRAYFVLGIETDINDMENTIKKAKQCIEDIDLGSGILSTKRSREELLDLIATKREKIDNLRRAITEFDFMEL